MAGYRPKSLGELNDMYDKTITAEKAILKATRIISAEEKKLSESVSLPEIPKGEQPVIPELSDEVNSLIASYNAAVTSSTAKKEPSQKPTQPVFTKKPELQQAAKLPETAPSPEKSIEEAEKKFKTESFAQPKNISLYSIEAPNEVKEKLSAKSDERTELFDDYMRIMNDEDDEIFTRHEAKKKKRKEKKASKKGIFFKKDVSHEENDDYKKESEFFGENLFSESSTDDSVEKSEPLGEIIYDPQVPVSFTDRKVIYEAEEEALETESAEELTEIPEDEPIFSEAVLEFETDDKKEDDLASDVLPKELQGKTYDEFMSEECTDIYSFDPNKENTIPDYAKRNYELTDDECSTENVLEADEEKSNDKYEANEAPSFDDYESEPEIKESEVGLLAGRIFLSIVLAVLILASIATIGINVVLGVNTGTAFNDKYFFTANETSSIANIFENDLVISENRFAEDGEVFAYINYTEQRFMFALKTGSVVNDNGDVVFVAENGTDRILVHRDDTRGVVSKAYATIGLIAEFCTNNFMLLISALLIGCLVIILLLTLVLKDNNKTEKKLKHKTVDEELVSELEASENAYTEEENDEDNLFSTID